MSDGQPVDLLVRGGTVVPCDGSRRVFVGDVAVRDGSIVAVTPASGGVAVRDGNIVAVASASGCDHGAVPPPARVASASGCDHGAVPPPARVTSASGCDHGAVPPAARVIDASGCAVIPGFVNSHTHEVLERGVFEDMDFFTWLEDFALPKDMAYEPRHQRAGSLLCQAEMIANGTTSFIDIFRFPAEAAAVAVDSGLRATISPQAVDTPAGAGETLESSEAFIDAWHGRHPRVRAWFGPHSLYTVDAATYTTMRERADHLGVGIHTHLAETAGEVERVAELSGGLTPAAWLHRLIGLGPGVVAAHCIELDDDDLALVASTGVGVAHCATSNMKLGHRAARIPELLAAGATVGLGTDSIMTNNNLDPFEEMRQAGLLARFTSGDPAVLPCAEILEMATIGGARVLGLGDEVGSIEPGKRADLAVVGLDRPHTWPVLSDGDGGNVIEQLVWSCSGSDVRYTVVDGEILLDDRRLTTLDLAMIADLVPREARHLLSKAGVLDHVLDKYRGDGGA